MLIGHQDSIMGHSLGAAVTSSISLPEYSYLLTVTKKILILIFQWPKPRTIISGVLVMVLN